MMRSEQTDAGAGEGVTQEEPGQERRPEREPSAQAAAAEGEGPPERQESGDPDAEALRDRFLRLAAEFDNYRKRTERERAESWTRAQAQLVERLLDGLDDLQRVADFAPATSVESLLEGVQMVERKLLRALESAGLEVVEATGQPFDPAVHDALMTGVAENEEEDETVGQVLQKGYRFNNILLRPARVQVRKFNG